MPVWDTLRLLVVLLAAGSGALAVSTVWVFLLRWRTCDEPNRRSDVLLLRHVVTMAAYVVGMATFTALVTQEHRGEEPTWRLFAALLLNAVQFAGLGTVYAAELWMHRRQL